MSEALAVTGQEKPGLAAGEEKALFLPAAGEEKAILAAGDGGG
jgi:hypothetical protein